MCRKAMKLLSCLSISILQLFWMQEVCHSFQISQGRKTRSTFVFRDTDSEFSVKLKAEAAAPFRLFRSFVYVTLGAAAGLGTLTTVPQLIHQLAEHANPTSTLTNLAINTGGLLITGYLLSKEATNEKRLRKNLSSTQALSENKLNPTEIRTREELLLLLPVEIQVSETNENTTRIFPLYDLVNQGKQHIVIVAGGSSFVRDAIIAARLMDESTFSSNEIMIIPYINDINLMNDKTNNKGVGTVKDPLMSEPLFAKPQQSAVWRRILQREVDVAALQQQCDATRIWELGIIIAINNQGKVVRRGLGAPSWVAILSSFK